MPADPARTGRARAATRVVGRLIVGAWLAVGLALATLLILESTARWMARGPKPRSVNDATEPASLSDQVLRDQARRAAVVGPYRGEWSLPLRTRFVNIDSSGRRVTPQPAPVPQAGHALLLGGSEMWGWNAPDSATIPARVAASLHASGVTDLAVINLAQPDFTAMQSAMTLLVELARGARPRVVVVLDGYAEVAVAARHGEPGRTKHETDVQQQVEVGQRPFTAEVLGLPRHSKLLGPLFHGSNPAPAPSPPAAAALCSAVADHYGKVAAQQEGLARTFGFELLRFLAPPPRMPPGAGARAGRSSSLIARCFDAIVSTMATRPGLAFVALGNSIPGETGIGPDGEIVLRPEAYEAIADRIASAVVATMRQPAGDSARRR